MVRSLLRAFDPSAYRYGRPVAAACLVYLTLVVGAAGFVIYDEFFPDPDAVGVSFAGLPLIVLTAPASFVAAEPMVAFQHLIFTSGSGVAHPLSASLATVAPLVAAGVVQAAVVWLLLRGPRITGRAS